MAIESLSLKGFKSFGNLCEFNFKGAGFTAIVGPNGSGKSNILDALRWILGEGVNSSLRITKQSDLLFAGSKSVSPAQEAEVILSFNNNNVLRRVYSQNSQNLSKSGGALYFNNKKILLQDLDALKPSLGLEGEGFAFIGQGEVSAAIHQRPKERRRQLDLLFGIERYRDMRDDSIKRLDDALSEGERIKTLIAELETRRAEIADDVAVAVEAQGIIDNLEILRRDFYFSRRYEIERKELELRSAAQIVKMRLELAERWQSLWRMAVKRGEESMKSSGLDLNLLNAFKSNINDLSFKLESLQRKAFQAAMRVKSIKESRVNLLSEQDNFASQKDLLNKDFEELKLTLDENLKLRDERASELKLKEAEINKSLENFEREKKRRQALRNELAERQLFCANAEANINAIKISSQASLNELNSLLNNQAVKAQELENLSKDLESLDLDLNNANLAYNQASGELKAKNLELNNLRREILKREADIDLLRDNIESSAYPEPVRILLEASRKNLIKSKPVPVAEVFKFKDNKIALALEAFLGARQAWLLAEDFDEAQEGIEFLKSRRGGRVTYLPLDRARPRDRDYRINLSKFNNYAEWVMDLIEIQEPWHDCIAHIMGDLLIVENYALGSKLVHDGARFPIVTLEGEVFAPAGTVSGGNIRQKGSAVIIQGQIAQVQNELNNFKDKYLKLDKILKELDLNEKDLLAKLETLNLKRGNLNNLIVNAKRELNNIDKDIKRLDSDNKSSQAKILKLETELKEALIRVDELDKEILNLSELENVLEPEIILKPLRAALELADERLKTSRDSEKRFTRELDNLSLKLKNIDDELNAINQEERLKRELLKNLGGERKRVYSERLKLKLKVESAQDLMQHERVRFERLNKRSGHADAAVLSRRSEIENFDEKLNALSLEREQLTELWDEKYKYDKDLAREVEGGRGLTSSLRKLERELKQLGDYNLGALREDMSLTERIDYLSDQLNDVENGADELRNLINSTDAQVEETFTRAMREIDLRFNALFQRLFAGGEARLILQDGDNIWDRGVEIYARPPGKKLQNISQLSGGEQSLTAIAQLFAALEVAKVPMAVLDEVDAALDEYNLIRFADLAKDYSRAMQIIVMTHRRTTMERADLIYGVTMTMVEPGLSRIVGIDINNYK
ncbi:MAG: chromosome segregation protein SMC [Synergistaceae bacterium]|nr:chromosome segregation protein SMC [Synergistaceae bacterium]